MKPTTTTQSPAPEGVETVTETPAPSGVKPALEQKPRPLTPTEREIVAQLEDLLRSKRPGADMSYISATFGLARHAMRGEPNCEDRADDLYHKWDRRLDEERDTRELADCDEPTPAVAA